MGSKELLIVVFVAIRPLRAGWRLLEGFDPFAQLALRKTGEPVSPLGVQLPVDAAGVDDLAPTALVDAKNARCSVAPDALGWWLVTRRNKLPRRA